MRDQACRDNKRDERLRKKREEELANAATHKNLSAAAASSASSAAGSLAMKPTGKGRADRAVMTSIMGSMKRGQFKQMRDEMRDEYLAQQRKWHAQLSGELAH